MKKNILIKNGTIVTLGDNIKVLTDYALSIEDGVIKALAPVDDIKGEYDKIIDATGKLIMPGFINTHMHFYSTLVRGLGKAKPSGNFNEVLENLWWRLDKELNMDDIYYSALIMSIQAIKNGCTTLIDHHASPGTIKGSLATIAKAVRQCGLRASLCYELSDRDGPEIALEGLEENVSFIRECQSVAKDQIKALFGLHASFTVGDDILGKAAEMGRSLNAGFHVHTAEAASDQEHCLAEHGMRVVERFYQHGILGPRSIAAHCVHIDEKEMALLAQTGTAVVHNPQSNLNNAVGIADVVAMTEKGITVGLGTDAMTVNMMEELRVALWAQHYRHQNPSIGFMEVANTLFQNNRIIAMRHWDAPLGELKEGAAADVILMDYLAPTPLTEETILGHLIFGVSQSTVDTTIAGGRILMENKQLKIDIDEKEANVRALECAAQLWERF
ncbi:putative aminohydrolase SsnA [bacterium]|nr:putative aminohydrolase SsnA [bacterium]